MQNLLEKYGDKDQDFLFLEDNAPFAGRKILVTKRSWFSWTPISQTYDQWGKVRNLEHYCGNQAEDGNFPCQKDGAETCSEFKVLSMDYWNGSNWQTVVIQHEEIGTDGCRYTEITDKADIERFILALKNAKFFRRTTGHHNYTANGLLICQSIWQGHFELFSISEDTEI